MLKIAKDLSLPAEAVTQTFAALGRRGSGKTNTAVVMAEEMLRAGHVIVWLDPIGVAWGLRSEFPILIAGGERGDIPLEATGGKLMAEFIVENRVPCILDVSLFGENEMRRFVGEFAATFYRINRDPVHWFVDEADEFAPQSGMNAEGAKCLGAMQNIVRRGRARGIGVTLITQRSAVLNKSVLTQTECLFALQTTAPHDLHAIEDWLKYHGTPEECKLILRDLPKLQQGECYVYSPGWLKLLKRVKIRARDTHDSSRTPKPGERKTEPRTLAQVDLASLKGQMAATVEKAKANDPKLLQARIRELEKEAQKSTLAQTSKVAKPVVDQDSIDRAVTANNRDWQRKADARDREWEAKLRDANRSTDLLARRLNSGHTAALKLAETLHLNGEAPKAIERPAAMSAPAALSVAHKVDRPSPRPSPPPSHPREKVAVGDVELQPAHTKILDALAWLEQLGIGTPDRGIAAAIAGVSPRSSSFANNVSRLHTLDLISYPSQPKGSLALTDTGRDVASYDERPQTNESVQKAWIDCKAFDPAHVKILKAVIEAYPEPITREDLASRVEVSAASSSFANNVSRLSSFGLIRYPDKGQVVANEPMLFPV